MATMSTRDLSVVSLPTTRCRALQHPQGVQQIEPSHRTCLRCVPTKHRNTFTTKHCNMCPTKCCNMFPHAEEDTSVGGGSSTDSDSTSPGSSSSSSDSSSAVSARFGAPHHHLSLLDASRLPLGRNKTKSCNCNCSACTVYTCCGALPRCLLASTALRLRSGLCTKD